MSTTSTLSHSPGLGAPSKPNSLGSQTKPNSSPNLSAGKHDSIALARCLSALTSKILTNPPSSLLHSAYERSKTNANLEYARTLLLRLEHATASARVQTRKHAAQARLAEQRAQLKVLGDRLWEIGQADNGTGEVEGQPDPLILKLVGDGTGAQQEAKTVPEVVVEDLAKPVEVASAVVPASASTESHLRARKQLLSSSSYTTGTSLPSTAAPSSTTSFSAPNTAAYLDLQNSVQTDLTQSMLSLAAQLKASAQRFADTLEADANTVGRTEDALGRNQAGLDSATKKMGVLSKMSEGRWWWGRMVLYAGIVALWIVAVLIVFVGPKLRF